MFHQDRSHTGWLAAFASDEAEFVQRFTKKVPYMRLTVGNAGARRNFALTESRNRARLV
ncbi:MAG TPA: hypothetical protein VGF53_09060 [Pseudolabrys sp.]